MARSEVMALRSIVMSQQTVITQLQEADRRSQTMTSEMAVLRTADRTRQEQLVQTLTLMQSLRRRVTTLLEQVTALQGQQGPFRGPAQPVAPEEVGSIPRIGYVISLCYGQGLLSIWLFPASN
ncbi:hypothetical protein Tco_1362050 [Tanacetum coccineum]